MENFKALFKINIIMAARHTPTGKKSSYISALAYYIVGGLILALMYSPLFIFSRSPFMPIIYETFLVFLFVIGLVQSFTLFYNSLYQAKDLDSLMALPISSYQIYLAKIVTVAVGSLPIIIPMVVMTMIYCHIMAYPILLNLVLSIYNFAIIVILYLFINIILMEILSYSGLLYNFSDTILTVFNTIVQIASILFIFLFKMDFGYDETIEIQSGQDRVFGLISGLLRDHRQLGPYLIASLLVSFMAIVVIKKLGDNFLDHYQAIQNKKHIRLKKSSKSSLSKSLRRAVYRYKLKYINNNTVISTSLVGVVFMSIYPMISIIRSGEVSNTIFLSFAIYLACVNTLLMNSLASNIISLDNNNFEILKSLPISMAEYLTYNVELVTILMSGISVGLLAVGTIIFKLSPLYLLLASILNIILTYALSCYKVYKDYEDVYIGWKSEAELYQRGNKALYILQFFVILILYTILVVFIMTMVSTQSSHIADIILVVGGLLLAIVIYLINSDKIASLDKY